jgi:hypothetical protein
MPWRKRLRDRRGARQRLIDYAQSAAKTIVGVMRDQANGREVNESTVAVHEPGAYLQSKSIVPP